MENNYWENCSYYESGECPQPEAIDRAFLIPQLLDASEIEATEQIFLNCGKYSDKRRKHPRIKSLFKLFSCGVERLLSKEML